MVVMGFILVPVSAKSSCYEIQIFGSFLTGRIWGRILPEVIFCYTLQKGRILHLWMDW